MIVEDDSPAKKKKVTQNIRHIEERIHSINIFEFLLNSQYGYGVAVISKAVAFA